MGVITRTANAVFDMFVYVMCAFLIFIALLAGADVLVYFAPSITSGIAHRLITAYHIDPYTLLFFISLVITTILKLTSTHHKEE